MAQHMGPTTGEVILYQLSAGAATNRELGRATERTRAQVYVCLASLGALVRRALGRWHLAPLPRLLPDQVRCGRRQRRMSPGECYDLFSSAAVLDAAPDPRNPCVGCHLGAANRLAYAGVEPTPVLIGATLRCAFGKDYGLRGHITRSEDLLEAALGGDDS